MDVRVKKWLRLLVVVACLIGSYIEWQSDAHCSPEDFETRAVFELVVNDSSVLKGGQAGSLHKAHLSPALMD